MWVRFLLAGPRSCSKMVLHSLGKTEFQVQFLARAPLDKLKERPYNSRMYKVIEKQSSTEFANLDLALAFAKELNVFVTIQGGEFEIVGVFGVDSIKDGKCPDGVKYDWNKASRIGRVKKER